MGTERWLVLHDLAGNTVHVRSDAVLFFGECTDEKYGDGCKLRLVGGDEVFVRASVVGMTKLLGIEAEEEG